MPISSPRGTASAFRVPIPGFYGDIEKMLASEDMAGVLRALIEGQRRSDDVLRGVMTGKINVVGTVTLTASQATTTLTDSRIGAGTAVILVPTTANASAEIGNGTIYQTYPNATKEQAVLNNANNAQTDRDFVFALIG
ncbi:MAG: hypothetical protein ACTSU0_11840 [Alphaproteobacteria bacterium]